MANRFIYYPFRFGAQGVALTDDADRHLRDKVEAVLFTAPGERINNPKFGVGLNKSLFEGLDDLTISALEFRIVHGLTSALGQELIIDEVALTTEPEGGELLLRLNFRRRTDREPRNLEIKL